MDDKIPIQYVVWDWNGTLLDDAWVFVDVLNALLISRKLSIINKKQYKNLFCFPIKDFYSRKIDDIFIGTRNICQ